MSADAIRWHYERQSLPGYQRLTEAHESVNWWMADAEMEPDADVAVGVVKAAFDQWVIAYRAWHATARGRIPR